MLRFHRRLACALALALSVSALWAAGAGAAIVGANANALFVGEWRGQVSSAQVDEQLTLMRAAGVTDVRTDASWQDAEPAPGVYNWSHDDEIASRLAAHGLTWTADIVYAPGWSNGTSAYATLTPGGTLVHPPPTPAHYADYAAYAAQVQARYHPAAIQIWNEPDLWAFWYRPDLQQDPAAYARLFELSRSAIKAVDPHARVMSTLSQFGRRFLAHVVAADPRYHPDALGWHTYYGTPQEDLASLHSDESQADALGLQVPVYLDEWGWLAGPYQMPGGEWDLTAEQRRSYFAPMLNGVEADPRVAESDWYTWVTDGPWSFTSADLAAFTAAVAGLHPPGTPKPAGIPKPPTAPAWSPLQCAGSNVVLLEASLRAGRVVLSGATAPAFGGARVRVTMSGSSRTLATASVGTSGRFTASVPAPRVPARARYVVRAAGSASAPLALMHRLSAYATVGRAGDVLWGRVRGPLGRSRPWLRIARRSACGRWSSLAGARLGADGRFRDVLSALPAGSLFLLSGRVRASAGNPARVAVSALAMTR